MSGAQDVDLSARLAKVEAELAIRQLAVRYALAVDSRDIDAWTSLFVANVDCGRFGKGREALHGFIEPALKTFYRSVHLVCGHIIDIEDKDRATGKVYCRAEHETGEGWIVVPILYSDEYRRENGEWLFVLRKEAHWYATDATKRPTGDNLNEWAAPGDPKLPGLFETWSTFWNDVEPDEIAELTSQPVEPRRTS